MNSHIKLAIIGTRGIPAKYGGSEVITEELAIRLANMGVQVLVTCESNRYNEDIYMGVKRMHFPSVQGRTFTLPTINEIIATCYLLIKHPDITVYYYTNPDISLGAFLPKWSKKKILINTDGIEWKRPLLRAKYLPFFSKIIAYLGALYLRFSEWLAIKLAHQVIADSQEIKKYLQKTYNAKNVVYITYGARQLLKTDIDPEKESNILKKYNLETNRYFLTVARIVAENNIHMEIEGWKKSDTDIPLVIIGNFNNKDSYSRHLESLRKDENKVVFLNPVFDQEELGVIRKNCFAYIHAYELGGTNPSLLEQMFFNRPVLALAAPFNKEVLGEDGLYFHDVNSFLLVLNLLITPETQINKPNFSERLDMFYNWNKVIEHMYELFIELS